MINGSESQLSVSLKEILAYGRKKRNHPAVDAQGKEQGNSQGSNKFHQEHKELIIPGFVLPVAGKLILCCVFKIGRAHV